MEIKPQIFISKVMHKRFFPKENLFNYNVYYLKIPLKNINNISKIIKFNKFGLISFYEKDYGYKDSRTLEEWVAEVLKNYNLNFSDYNVSLITLPRVAGYVFNPVSFYFLHDDLDKLKIVIAEVNNTFGESHTYICFDNDGGVLQDINANKEIIAKKIFHVSPFLKRQGYYKFRFSENNNKLGIFIDYFDDEGKLELATSLIGHYEEMNKINIIKCLLKYPFISFKTIILIHYQAIKLIFKKVKYIRKPEQLKEKISR